MQICEPKLPHLSPPPTWSTPLEIIGLIGMGGTDLSNKFNKLLYRLLHVGSRKHILDLSRKMRTLAA